MTSAGVGIDSGAAVAGLRPVPPPVAALAWPPGHGIHYYRKDQYKDKNNNGTYNNFQIQRGSFRRIYPCLNTLSEDIKKFFP